MRPQRKIALTLCLLTSVGAVTGTAQLGAQQRARINDIEMAYLSLVPPNFGQAASAIA